MKEKPSRKFREEHGWVIGSDETMKGDTFGGIVVAGVKADDKIRAQLWEIGVADSKTLADSKIVRLAEKIRKIAPCEVKSLFPEEYNKQDGNMTELLNLLHSQVGKYLQPGRQVVDKYPGCKVGEVIEEKAESKYLEVAAASILARDAALKQWDYLSQEAGFTVPKGSTHVQEGLRKLKESGLPFRKFVKINFKNVKEFL